MSEIIKSKADYAAIYDAEYYSGKKSFFYKFSGGYRDYRSYFDRLAHWFAPYMKAGVLLDCGCAYGFMLKRYEGQYTLRGCDISDHALEQARQLVPSAELHKVFLGQDKFPWADGSVDTIITNDVVEHLNADDIGPALDDFARVLKRGGRLCITTPNGNWIRKLFYRVADRMEHHIGLRHMDAWTALLQQHGFKIVTTWTYFHGLFPFRMRGNWFFAEAAIVAEKL